MVIKLLKLWSWLYSLPLENLILRGKADHDQFEKFAHPKVIAKQNFLKLLRPLNVVSLLNGLDSIIGANISRKSTCTKQLSTYYFAIITLQWNTVMMTTYKILN